MCGARAVVESIPGSSAGRHMDASLPNYSFGYLVRRYRQALDLTQTDLARQVGCALVTISKIERDERRPSRQMAGILA
ncbi:MAG: helix-turn-helix transcriptional regulator, partial [Caldilinea sp.]|nr:helix-turn-helix transcriptional regulator [Caldilinea sp.]